MSAPTISQTAHTRREDAREKTGEFGNQTHADPGIISLPDQTPAERFAAMFTEGVDTWDAAGFAAVAANNHDLSTILEWANHGLDGVSHDQITLAFDRYAADGAAEDEMYDENDPDATFQRMAVRFDKVIAEAKRRHDAMNRIVGHSHQTGTFETTGEKHDGTLWDTAQIAKGIRADLKLAHEEGLLPEGTTAHVTTRKFAGGQSVTLMLSGIPDSKRFTQESFDLGLDFGERTQYVIALEHHLERFVNAYNREDIDSSTDYWNVHYYGQAIVETERGAAWRELQAAERKANKAAGR